MILEDAEGLSRPLSDYILFNEETLLEFSKKSEISLTTLYKFFNGGKINRETALKIEFATDYELTAESLIYPDQFIAKNPAIHLILQVLAFRKVSIKEFSLMLDISYNYFSYFINGKKPGKRLAKKIERILDGIVTAEELLDGQLEVLDLSILKTPPTQDFTILLNIVRNESKE